MLPEKKFLPLLMLRLRFYRHLAAFLKYYSIAVVGVFKTELT